LNFPFNPGDRISRFHIHSLLGGSFRGGIAPCSKSPNVLLFSDPERGRPFGYDVYEGLRPDGYYNFTGEGKSADQEPIRGNKAILEHKKTNRSLKLFVPEEDLQVYVGEVQLAKPEYFLLPAPDKHNFERQVFVFNLQLPEHAQSLPLPITNSPNIQNRAIG